MKPSSTESPVGCFFLFGEHLPYSFSESECTASSSVVCASSSTLLSGVIGLYGAAVYPSCQRLSMLWKWRLATSFLP